MPISGWRGVRVRITGRDAECARLTQLVADARSGHGRSLVLRGEAGIGKTALLNHLAETAEGFTVVRTTGVEFESELALAALGELIRPLHTFLPDLPPRYASALAPFMPQRSVPEATTAAADRHSIYAATLALLSAAAVKQPLLCLIDDAHWVDRASIEALLFTARRLLEDSTLMVFATRDVADFDAPGVETIRLDGLDESASLQLLARGGELPALVATRLAALTMGNPLALLELPRVLALDSPDGLTDLVEPLPTSQLLQRAFAAPLQSMTRSQRQALLVCATAGNVELEVVARALATLDVDLAALDAATDLDMVRVVARAVTFRHPLVRSAVYSQAGPGERRAAHLALAQTSTSPEDADRRAWHFAHAATGPDEAVAAALATTAERARDRGGVVAQAAALERAAELTPDPLLRASRLCDAAHEWAKAGALDHSGALLDQAEALAGSDRTARIDVLGHRAYHAVLRGRPGDIFDVLVAEAEDAGPSDRLVAGRLLSMAMNAPLGQWDVAGTLAVCTKVMELTSPDGPNPLYSKGAVRMALAQVLAGLPEGAELARQCVPVCESHDPDGACAELAEVLTSVEEYDLARRMIDRDIEGARDIGDVSLLAYSLPRRAQLELRVGRPLAGYSDALEGVTIAEAMGQLSNTAGARAALAMATAVLGRAEDCAVHAAEAVRLSPADLDIEARARHALGHVALAGGRIEEAATDLGRADALMHAGGVVEPAVIPVAADLVEALLRAGRPEEARVVLDRLDAAVATTDRRGRRAAALRCHALAARGASAERLFREALDAHAVAAEPLERARTQLCFGQWLRRARRRRDAHEHLAEALRTFESAGARLWAEQARHELATLGMRAQPESDRPDPGVLTPQEWRIAWAAAQGQTSREIAMQVLLSTRTVDYHLGNVYRKLGVRSRRALIDQLAAVSAEPSVGR